MCFFLVAGIDVGDETLRKENSISETFHKANSFKHVGPSFGKVLALFWEGVWWTKLRTKKWWQGLARGWARNGDSAAPTSTSESWHFSRERGSDKSCRMGACFSVQDSRRVRYFPEHAKKAKGCDEEKCNSTLWSVSCLCLDNVFLVR